MPKMHDKFVFNNLRKINYGYLKIIDSRDREHFFGDCKSNLKVKLKINSPSFCLNLLSKGSSGLGESYINRSHSLFMGFRRLSILDLSSYANQPIISENKKFVMMFNGEIYNFKSLNKKYLNNIYKNTSDTKILIELFSKIGIENTLL